MTLAQDDALIAREAVSQPPDASMPTGGAKLRTKPYTYWRPLIGETEQCEHCLVRCHEARDSGISVPPPARVRWTRRQWRGPVRRMCRELAAEQWDTDLEAEREAERHRAAVKAARKARAEARRKRKAGE